MLNNKKIVVLLTLGALLILPLLVQGSSTIGDVINDLDQTAQNAKIIEGNPEEATAASIYKIMGRVINMVLSVLGAIFLIQTIYGGLRWMTAAGNSEAVKNAHSLIIQSIIGIIIILSAYLLTNYIIFKIIEKNLIAAA